MTVKFSSKIFIASSIAIALGFITGTYVLAAYNVEKAKHFKYPISELGSCGSFDECKAYCNKDENIPTCVRFDIKNNLLTQSEAADAEKMLSLMDKSGLPGKCTGNVDCFTYCESAAHFDECFDYAKRHDLIPAGWNADDMKKLSELHKQGLQFPGNCQGKGECETYCESPAHIDECLAFAEKANILPPDQLAEAKKFAPFIKSGETPGGCKSKAECVSYCSDSAHSEECVSFLEKAGFMTHKEADLVKKFKGKSPGDCAKGATSFAEGQKACNAFCNDPTNQPVCFKFMEEGGIMTAEEATQVGAMSDFQACVPISPPEIQQCFIDNLGQDLFNAMKQGALPLDEDIQDMMIKIRAARACVNRYADQTLTTFTNNPDALACIDSELGKDYLEKAKRGEVKCGDAAQSQKKIESCVETALSAKLDHCFALACSEATTCIKDLEKTGEEKSVEINPELKTKIDDKLSTCIAEKINECVAKPCSGFQACLGELGGSGGQQGKSNPAIEDKIKSCTPKKGGGGQGNNPEQQQRPQMPSSQGSSPQIDCSSFASVPQCSYVGSPDSDSYKYCKQCFPNK